MTGDDRPRTAHGFDAALYLTDPVYHKLVRQGAILRRHYAYAHGFRSPLITPEEFERLYTFGADDWLVRQFAE